MAGPKYTTDPDGLMKTCSNCPEKGLQPRAAFYKDARSKSGLTSQCKKCMDAGQVCYRKTPARRVALQRYDTSAKGRAATQRFRESPHGQQTLTAYSRSPARRARQSRFRLSAEGVAAIQRYVTSAHGRAVIRAGQARYRARKRGLPATHSVRDALFLRVYWQDACAVCGDRQGLWKVIALDHWIPLSSPECPGTVPGNMVPLCHARKGLRGTIPDCNVSKHGQDPMEWLIHKLGERKAKRKSQEIQRFFDAALAYAEAEQQSA